MLATETVDTGYKTLPLTLLDESSTNPRHYLRSIEARRACSKSRSQQRSPRPRSLQKRKA